MAEDAPEQSGPPAWLSSARDVALSALGDRAGHVTLRLGRLLEESRLSPADQSLARELTLGVVRHQRTLDVVLSAFLDRPDARLESRLRSILRLGLYQVLFLQRVPDFAAVNEAVKQVRQPHQRGFVNGLLRGIIRAVAPPEQGTLKPGRDILPIGSAAWRRFDRPVFADPATGPQAYLAEALSLPDELAEKWLNDRGLDTAMRLALHANARPPVILRVDLDRITHAAAIDALTQAGLDARPHRNGTGIVLFGPADIAQVELFRQGLVQPQDPTAAGVVAAGPVAPGMRVLDLCAAPGTKTIQLAQRMRNEGQIIACDINDDKLERVRDGARRAGVTIVKTMLAQELPKEADRPFDLALVDAPCSNTGVLARRAEARWRFTRDSVLALAGDQRRLLLLALNLLKPGGTCLYSTCSLEPEENRRVVGEALSRFREARLVREQETLPSGAEEPTAWADGGYFAILRRQ